MKRRINLTQERLKEVLNYNSKTGIFTWKINGNKGIKVGDVGGVVCKSGYRYIYVDKVGYLAHRLVFLYVDGYFPENYIDHINRNRDDNRVSNLREVNRSCNARNYGNRKDNFLGVRGVNFWKSRNKWIVQIRINNKLHYLGMYKDFIEAVYVRLAVEQCINWNVCGQLSPAAEYIKRIRSLI